MEKESIRPKKTSFFSLGFTLWFLVSFTIVFFLFGATTEALIMTVVMYAVSIGVSLTPIGEWLFRLLTGARPLANQHEINRITPLFQAVYEKAKAVAPWLSDKVNIYIVDDLRPNAAAIGKKTIYVTKGLLMNCTDDEIMGVLGHEFAHLANGDTMSAIVATVGNFVLAVVLMIVRLFFRIILAFASADVETNPSNTGVAAFGLLNGIIKLFDLIIAACMFLGVVAAMYSSRKMEHEADKFSVRLGYGYGLLSFMQKLEMVERASGTGKLGVMAAMTASHPKTPIRIGVVEEELKNLQTA